MNLGTIFYGKKKKTKNKHLRGKTVFSNHSLSTQKHSHPSWLSLAPPGPRRPMRPRTQRHTLTLCRCCPQHSCTHLLSPQHTGMMTLPSPLFSREWVSCWTCGDTRLITWVQYRGSPSSLGQHCSKFPSSHTVWSRPPSPGTVWDVYGSASTTITCSPSWSCACCMPGEDR